MKFSLVAALLVVLAVAHGTEASSSQKRDVQGELDRLSDTISGLSSRFTGMTQGVLDRVKAQPRLYEQVMPLIASLENRFKPLADSLPAQLKQMSEMVEKLYQLVMD